MTNANQTPAKPVLSKDVADSIVHLLNINSNSVKGVLSDVIEEDAGEVINDFINTDESHFDVLLSALVNGYTVEQTPEAKVREYYHKYYDGVHMDGGYEDGFEDGVAKAVRTTLDLLGIKIEGVNAPDEHGV